MSGEGLAEGIDRAAFLDAVRRINPGPGGELWLDDAQLAQVWDAVARIDRDMVTGNEQFFELLHPVWPWTPRRGWTMDEVGPSSWSSGTTRTRTTGSSRPTCRYAAAVRGSRRSSSISWSCATASRSWSVPHPAHKRPTVSPVRSTGCGFCRGTPSAARPIGAGAVPLCPVPCRRRRRARRPRHGHVPSRAFRRMAAPIRTLWRPRPPGSTSPPGSSPPRCTRSRWGAARERLLDLVRSFSVFQWLDGRTVRLVARHQQYRAVSKTVRRLVGEQDPAPVAACSGTHRAPARA